MTKCVVFSAQGYKLAEIYPKNVLRLSITKYNINTQLLKPTCTISKSKIFLIAKGSASHNFYFIYLVPTYIIKTVKKIKENEIIIANLRNEIIFSSTEKIKKIDKSFLLVDKLSGKKIKGEYFFSTAHLVKPLNCYIIILTEAKKVISPIRKMWLNTIIIVTLFVIFSLLPISIIVKTTFLPLERLKLGVKRIAQGDLQHRIDIGKNSDDEINILAKEFNTMAENLRNLEEVKKNLLNMIIHDLKNPLTAILSGIEIIRAYFIDGKIAKKEDLNDIFVAVARSANNMISMINDMLDVAKMEEGKFHLILEKVYLPALLSELVEEYQLVAKNENKIFNFYVDKNMPWVEVDKKAIYRTVSNLLSNAFKYTRRGGEVRLLIENEDNRAIKVSVQNTGEGIPEEWKERIFDKFTQIYRRDEKLPTGAGLGLTFCKLVVEAHKGKIFVDNAQKGWTTFTFIIPV
jgi:signal transduction histidine kinase